MTDYEMIIIFLTILALLVAVDKKNGRYMRTAGQIAATRRFISNLHLEREGPW